VKLAPRREVGAKPMLDLAQFVPTEKFLPRHKVRACASLKKHPSGLSDGTFSNQKS
jgi:hypothetical protein